MSAPDITMHDVLSVVIEEGASDVHFTVNTPPVLRLHGRMHTLQTPPLAPEDTERLAQEILEEENVRQLEEHGSTDFAYAFENGDRFRVNVYRQRGNLAIALRLIPSLILPMNVIGLGPHIQELLYRPRGLVLVTGPTGSGKTTTLASMINYINEQRDCHIVTIEDPVEYTHEHKKSIVNQRELHADTPSFSEALRGALRQDPDVILVGEMRDLATMEAAITAAETGHLVFATLHTTGAARTVDRIVDAFPMEQQSQIRTQLGSSILAVISQVLLPRSDQPGRVAGFEIMIATNAIRALIRDNKTFRIDSDIQTGGKHGMITLDDHLVRLCNEGKITEEAALLNARRPDEVANKI